MPLAPGLFSTMTLCPRLSDMCLPTTRASMSVVPPGAYGTIMRMGLSGNAAAWATSGEMQADATESKRNRRRSEEHTSELQSLMRISYADICLQKKNQQEK